MRRCRARRRRRLLLMLILLLMMRNGQTGTVVMIICCCRSALDCRRLIMLLIHQRIGRGLGCGGKVVIVAGTE